ncbi:MAG TPA: GNAT family N-acetyltransferase, partial [Vicinamibacterales bacterium]|nr:GNAT family N-acetyltransferase [Vicinamibacterales bacterium]
MGSAPALVVAEGALHERILDQTYPVWNEGLTRARYGHYNLAQMRTRWGARHLSRLALVDGDQLLASAKRYDLDAVLDGRPVRVVGIGAVFTPPELRRRGYGIAIVNAILDRVREDGCELALLFSEIGPAYYERLGFTRVPLQSCVLRVKQGDGAPAVPVRSGEESDLAVVADIHARRAASFRFALRYDADWLQYSLAKRRLFAGLSDPGARQIEFFVVEEGGRAAAWVLLHVERSPGAPGGVRWTVESCGDRDPDGARIGAILQAALARSPAGP